MNLQELSEKLINKFDGPNQELKAISELGELIQALADHYCLQLHTKLNKDKRIIEEIADVEIMLDQLKEIFGREECAKELQRKMNKIEEML